MGKGKVTMRFISMILGICMILSLVSVSALASNAEESFSVTAKGANTITVQQKDNGDGTGRNSESSSDRLKLSAEAQTIERDYSQTVKINVSNVSDAPIYYYLTCENGNKDLSMNFVNSGSKDDPLTITPQETQEVELSVFAQNAAGTEYDVIVTANVLDGEGDSSEDVEMTLSFGVKAANGKISFQKGDVSESTLATDYTVKNTGKNKITDVTLSISGDAEKYVRIDPLVENYELKAGEEIDVLLIPNLVAMKNDGISSFTGKLIASGGVSASEEISFDTEGREISSTTFGELALLQSDSEYADATFDDDTFSFKSRVGEKTYDFSDITKQYYEEGNPEKDGVNNAEEFNEVLDTILDDQGMISFTVSDTLTCPDSSKTVPITTTVSTESVSATIADEMQKESLQVEFDTKADTVTYTSCFAVSNQQYLELFNGFESAAQWLDIKQWDEKYLDKKGVFNKDDHKVLVKVVNSVQGTLLNMPSLVSEFGATTFNYHTINDMPIGKLDTFYKDYSAIANSTGYQIVKKAGTAAKVVKTVNDVYKSWMFLSDPRISRADQFEYGSLMFAKNLNRYIGIKLLSKAGASIGTAIGDGPGAVVGYFAGTLVSGLLEIYMNKQIAALEAEWADDETGGGALYYDIFGHQCTNRGRVTSEFYVPDYAVAGDSIEAGDPTASAGFPVIGMHETGRMYEGNHDDGQVYTNDQIVKYTYTCNGKKIGENSNGGLTQVVMVGADAESCNVKKGKNVLERSYNTDGGHHWVTADSEITLILPSDAPISYIGTPEELSEVRLLPDFAVYKENISLQNAPIKNEKNTITVYVYNRGSQNGWANIVIRDGSEEIYSEKNVYMKAFSEKEITLEWTPESTGKAEISVDLTNAGLLMEERKSDNNTAKRSFTVRNRVVPTIESVSPEKAYEEESGIFLSAIVNDTLDLKEVRFQVDDGEVIGTKLSGMNGKVQATGAVKGLSVGKHAVKAIAEYYTGPNSTMTVEKKQEMTVKPHSAVTFTVTEELKDPQFYIYDVRSGYKVTTTVTRSGEIYRMKESTAMEGNEARFYLIIKTNDLLAVKRVDELNDSIIDPSKAKTVSIEDDNQAVFQTLNLYSATVGTQQIQLGVTFSNKKFRVYGIDSSSGDLQFTIAGQYMYVSERLEHDKDHIIKLADQYLLYQYDLSGMEGQNINGVYFPWRSEGSNETWTVNCSNRIKDGMLNVTMSGYQFERFRSSKTRPALVIYTESSVFVKNTSDYRKGEKLDDGKNHNVNIVCNSDTFQLSSVRLEMENGTEVDLYGETLSLPDGKYTVGIAYSVNGGMLFYEDTLEVKGKDIKINLPTAADENGTIQISWATALGDNGSYSYSTNGFQFSGNLEQNKKVITPVGEGYLYVDLTSGEERPYILSIYRNIVAEDGKTEKITINAAYSGTANLYTYTDSYYSGEMVYADLYSLADSEGNILRSYRSYSEEYALDGMIVFTDTNDSGKTYQTPFKTNSLYNLSFKLPEQIPEGTYSYVIKLSSDKLKGEVNDDSEEGKTDDEDQHESVKPIDDAQEQNPTVPSGRPSRDNAPSSESKAIKGLRSELEKAIEDAGRMNGQTFTDDSWNQYMENVKIGQSVLEKQNVTEDELRHVIESIEKAKSALDVKPVDGKTNPDSNEKFIDVPSGCYYEDAVVWATKNGITAGTSEDTFSPDAVCTRAQIVTFLWRAEGSPESKMKTMPFNDVKSSDYFYKAVLWAVENGITAGTSKTTFSPKNTVTRAQSITFLNRASGEKPKGSNPFVDIAKDAYYADAVTWAYNNNITAGISATEFGPNYGCQRKQIVTFLYKDYVR